MKKISNSLGMTLIELVIVVALIALLILAMLIFLNPFNQIKRSNAAKSKAQLNQLSKSFEEFYSNKDRYPKASDVCYNSESQEGSTCSCNICGSESSSPSFSPYVSTLPCDPQYPRSTYLYQYECTNGSWYKLYAILDPDSTAYQYGVASSNTSADPYPTVLLQPIPTSIIPTTIPTPTSAGQRICSPGIYCLDHGGNCNICDNGFEASTCLDPARCDIAAGFFDDTSGSSCTNACQLP